MFFFQRFGDQVDAYQKVILGTDANRAKRRSNDSIKMFFHERMLAQIKKPRNFGALKTYGVFILLLALRLQVLRPV